MRIIEDGVEVYIAPWPIPSDEPENTEIEDGPRVDIPDIISRRSSQSISSFSLSNSKEECKFPIFTILISLVQIVIFFALGENWSLLLFGYDPTRRHELWRLFTVVLVHSDPFHLWINIGLHLILGSSLEWEWSSRRVGFLYFISALGGSAAGSVAYPQKYSRGASGAVWGLLGAQFAVTFVNWNRLRYKKSRLFALAFCVIFEIGFSIWDTIFYEYRNTGVWVHVGGGLIGFLATLLILVESKADVWKFIMPSVILGGLLTAVMIINVGFPSYYLIPEWNFDYEASFSKYIWKLIILDLPADSVERKSCEGDQDCRRRLELFLRKSYFYNG